MLWRPERRCRRRALRGVAAGCCAPADQPSVGGAVEGRCCFPWRSGPRCAAPPWGASSGWCHTREGSPAAGESSSGGSCRSDEVLRTGFAGRCCRAVRAAADAGSLHRQSVSATAPCRGRITPGLLVQPAEGARPVLAGHPEGRCRRGVVAMVPWLRLQAWPVSFGVEQRLRSRGEHRVGYASAALAGWCLRLIARAGERLFQS